MKSRTISLKESLKFGAPNTERTIPGQTVRDDGETYCLNTIIAECLASGELTEIELRQWLTETLPDEQSVKTELQELRELSKSLQAKK